MVQPISVPLPQLPARNLIELLQERAKESTRTAAKYKAGGLWKDISWGEILERTRRVSEGLAALGVKPGDRVSIFAATRLDWVICDFGIMGAGAQTVPIYASNTPAECEWILTNSGASYIFIDNDVPDANAKGRLTRIEEIWARCPDLKKAILFDASGNESRTMTLKDLEAAGEKRIKAGSKTFDERVAALGLNDTANFIYTSGTTGNPKGVELTQGNWVYEAWAARQNQFMVSDELVLLFLPMAHSFAKVIEASWLGVGFGIAFAESVEKLVDNAQEVRPTCLPAVPRVFEKIFNKVVGDGAAAPGIKGKLFSWAMRHFEDYATARAEGREYHSLSFSLARKLVFTKIEEKLKARVGGRIRYFISGGAPLSRKIAYFFELCNFEILEGFGLTETSAGTCINLPGEARIGTVGRPFPGTEVRIAPDGEVLIRGPGVMKGYYKNPQATREVIDTDGWFHSGDIGELDKDGYLRITDRKKDIIITAGGKNVAPQNIEGELKAMEPLVSQVMVHGDKRKFLSALITVSEENVKKLAAEKGLTGDYAKLTQSAEVRKVIQAAVDRLNANLPSYETVKKFSILDKDFSQETGELTPTLKVKRKLCSERYRAVLDGFYDEKFD
jgi:long-chain acyl-CoA synthetase